MKGSVKLPVFIDDARKYVNTTQLRAKYLGASYEAEYCQWQTLHGLGSLMETASLIITPNAYLEGKLIASYPPDPIGDFDVTRATTATRVNSAGLVELVPYNLLEYSEQFNNGYWSNYQTSVTANTTTAPNGTLTADTITQVGAGVGSVYKSGYVFNGNQVTISCYFKANTASFAVIDSNPSSGYFAGNFNLATGTATTAGLATNATIENVGNGWFRCSVTATPNGTSYAAFLIAGNNGDTLYAWGAQLNEGSLKDYQKTETRLNIPRLDYSNGTCPSLLVEPQRTNQYLKSNDFVNWSNNNGTNTITPNYAISPDGIMNASRWVATGTGYRYNLYGLFTLGTTTVSIYAKRNNSGTQKFGFFLNGSGTVDYELNLTNEWQRFTYTFNLTNEYQGLSAEVGADVSIYGYQLEAGSYASSYIPTTSASVTRNADVISKTGISSLIGQTEGTLFQDIYIDDILNAGTYYSFLAIGTTGNLMFMTVYPDGRIQFAMFNGNVLQVNIDAPSYGLTTGRHKMAVAYKNNDFAFYCDGNLVGTANSGSVPATSKIDLTDTLGGKQRYNAAALWKTRLTNTQLAQLTTI
jgi:hypothetical protein